MNKNVAYRWDIDGEYAECKLPRDLARYKPVTICFQHRFKMARELGGRERGVRVRNHCCVGLRDLPPQLATASFRDMNGPRNSNSLQGQSDRSPCTHPWCYALHRVNADLYMHRSQQALAVHGGTPPASLQVVLSHPSLTISSKCASAFVQKVREWVPHPKLTSSAMNLETPLKLWWKKRIRGPGRRESNLGRINLT